MKFMTVFGPRLPEQMMAVLVAEMRNVDPRQRIRGLDQELLARFELAQFLAGSHGWKRALQPAQI